MPSMQPMPCPSYAVAPPPPRRKPNCSQKSSGHLRQLLEAVDELRQLGPQPRIPLCGLPLTASQGACMSRERGDDGSVV